MSLTGHAAWVRRFRHLAVVLHVIFVLAAPFGHHDLACHIRQPLHCTACVSSQLGSDPHTISLVGAWTLTDAGRAIHVLPASKSALLTVRSTGRSPPLAS